MISDRLPQLLLVILTLIPLNQVLISLSGWHLLPDLFPFLQQKIQVDVVIITVPIFSILFFLPLALVGLSIAKNRSSRMAGYLIIWCGTFPLLNLIFYASLSLLTKSVPAYPMIAVYLFNIIVHGVLLLFLARLHASDPTLRHYKYRILLFLGLWYLIEALSVMFQPFKDLLRSEQDIVRTERQSANLTVGNTLSGPQFTALGYIVVAICLYFLLDSLRRYNILIRLNLVSDASAYPLPAKPLK